MITLYTPAVQFGRILHFTSERSHQCYMHAEVIASLRVGALLCDTNGKALLLVIGKHMHYTEDTLGQYTLTCKVLDTIEEGTSKYTVQYKGYSIAWVTLSDSGSVGKRTDESGPLIGSILQNTFEVSVERGFLIPDDPTRLEHILLDLALFQRFNCILTTGGTGVAPRDTTPEVMEKILHRSLYGFELAMMQASMQYVSTAILSRARAGIIAETILINLPGSPKAVQQNLTPILPALQHAMDKLCGDPSDCAGVFAIQS